MGGGGKGKKKPKLRDYSHIHLTSEEKIALIRAVGELNQHSIVTAILGYVAIEHELDILLRRKFRKKDDEAWATLLDDRGPLRTFYTKIVTGYALGIYDDKTLSDLHVVRTIRNAFAHSKKLLSFDDQLIVSELLKTKCLEKKLLKILQKNPTADNAKGAYIIVCLRILTRLSNKLRRADKASLQRAERKLIATSPFARALLGSGVFGNALFNSPSGPPPVPESNVTSASDQSDGGPASSPKIGLLADLLAKYPKSNDDKGK